MRSAADPLAGGLVESFHQALLDGPDVGGVAFELNRALFFLKDGQAPGFFLFRNLIVQCERGRVGAPRIFEAENGIVLDFIQQRQRGFEVGFRSRRGIRR